MSVWGIPNAFAAGFRLRPPPPPIHRFHRLPLTFHPQVMGDSAAGGSGGSDSRFSTTVVITCIIRSRNAISACSSRRCRSATASGASPVARGVRSTRIRITHRSHSIFSFLVENPRKFFFSRGQLKDSCSAPRASSGPQGFRLREKSSAAFSILRSTVVIPHVAKERANVSQSRCGAGEGRWGGGGIGKRGEKGCSTKKPSERGRR